MIQHTSPQYPHLTLVPALTSEQSTSEEIPYAELPRTLHPLKVVRIQHNITQQMLADFTELSAPTIKRAEAGRAVSITAHRLICQYFGKTSRELGLRYQVRG